MKSLVIALCILATPSIAQQQQQQRTIYGADGRVAGHAATDTQGTTTIYDARGNVIGRVSGSKPQQPQQKGTTR